LQVGNTHATRRAILFKNLNYILREIYDILSEDALNYPVYMDELVKRIRTVHEVLCEQQWQVRSGDSDNPPLYKVGD